MTIFQITAIILTTASIGGYLNKRFFKLPSTIGHMIFALAFSVLVIACGKTGWVDVDSIRDMVEGIDFSGIVIHGMLAFLLFAGALHINLNDLKHVRLPVAILATAGVVIATMITGTLVFWGAQLIGINLPYIYALLFGALISPTDPIAVLGIMKDIKTVPQPLYMKIGGESLFNDGVGVVVFLSILGVAASGDHFEIHEFLKEFAWGGIGGIGLGLLLGWITFRLLLTIDDYKTEIMLTLALVAGGYALAELLGVSGPLYMVAAGLIIGNHGRTLGMSDTTREHLDLFWELVDDILNDVLFLLIGLEMIIISFTQEGLILGTIAIAAVLAGRLISVGFPILLMSFSRSFEKGTILLMTWGGLRGALSIAMALSLPNGPEKSIILTLTYIVVLFSILAQGMTFKKVLQSVLR